MRLFFLFFSLTIGISVFGQKKDLDTAAFHNWPMVEDGGLSPDGEYAYYYIIKEPGNIRAPRSLVLKSVHNDWSLTIAHASIVGFTMDNPKFAILRLPGDSVSIVGLETNRIRYLNGVTKIDTYKDCLIYRTKANDSLYIQNLRTGHSLGLSGICDIMFAKKRDALLVKQRADSNSFILSWLSLATGLSHNFYSGNSINQWKLDMEEEQVAFCTGEIGRRRIFVYSQKTPSLKCIVSDSTNNIETGCHIAEISRFTKNGKYLLFNITRDSLKQGTHTGSSVSVYKYTDMNINFSRERNIESDRMYLRSIDLANGKSRVIENEFEEAREDNGNYILIANKRKRYEWDEFLQDNTTYKLMRFSDGAIIELPEANACWFSPSGEWLLYFDPNQSAFKVIDLLKSGKHLSNKYNCIGDNWTYEQDGAIKYKFPIGLAGWINNGNSVLVYSRHGLWQIDMTESTNAKILTNSVLNDHYQVYNIAIPLTGEKNGDSIFISGFNTFTKEQAFYRCVLGRRQSLVCLSRGAWAIRMSYRVGAVPVKAENKSIFLLRRMTSETSPNYYITTDFCNFRPISNVYPERNYNWLKTVLIHWRSLDGGKLMGILYKPENFDSKKKYPLLLYYYEQLSDNLHVYNGPAASLGPINIPYMVSKGYLVFTPDIKYHVGYPGRSAYDAVVSAAQYLGTLQYVDKFHMGVQGHSFGGFETNYIVTHTSLFAAACSSSGAFDLITHYTELRGGAPIQMFVENGQYRMSLPPWKARDKYLDNSLIFLIDRVNTPLLLMNNWDDQAVDVHEGMSMFSALRRAEKPVWLLQYPGEGHILNEEMDRLDYTEKMMTFFDHFLKGAPEPAWMK